jgi:hypothetical protein
LEDWIRQIVEFKKIIAKSFRQIIEFKKTINKSYNYIGEAEKTIAGITGAFSNEHTNRDQSTYRASQ